MLEKTSHCELCALKILISTP
uniref:Uncharacterized protein n=1 Tax=Anguilla anguilla TaxID=7936 RepID=A0A0E9TFP6_ANGAN